MKAIVSADAYSENFIGYGRATGARFRMTREERSEWVAIEAPAGPKTKRISKFKVRLSELENLVEWMKRG